VGLLARRLTGKYIQPAAEHNTQKVNDIAKGVYDKSIEDIMAKSIDSMKELYNSREIEA